MEHFATMDLVLANRGEKLTYIKARRGLIIDITFISNALIRKCDWVSNSFTFNDHQAIHFTLEGVSKKRIPKVTKPKGKDKSLDQGALSVALQTLDWTPSSSPEGTATTPVHPSIEDCLPASEEVIPKGKGRR